jgi:sigma-B regulation protein RsbU (phosphoserine phosphatase)
MFVTVFYGVLDPTTGTLAYCNAGHSPPVLLDGRGTGAVRTLARTGMALGVLEEETWEQGVVRMESGDALVLYTDGVTEAQNADGALFSEDRLIPVVRDALGHPARQCEAAVLDALRRFVGPAPQSDDITLMVLVRE